MSRLSDVQLNIAQIPWVTYHRAPTPCSAASSRSTVRKRVPCRKTAHWRFRALRRSPLLSGDYCWSHLIHQGLYGDMSEEARTIKWLKASGFWEEETDVQQ